MYRHFVNPTTSPCNRDTTRPETTTMDVDLPEGSPQTLGHTFGQQAFCGRDETVLIEFPGSTAQTNTDQPSDSSRACARTSDGDTRSQARRTRAGSFMSYFENDAQTTRLEESVPELKRKMEAKRRITAETSLFAYNKVGKFNRLPAEIVLEVIIATCISLPF